MHFYHAGVPENLRSNGIRPVATGLFLKYCYKHSDPPNESLFYAGVERQSQVPGFLNGYAVILGRKMVAASSGKSVFDPESAGFEHFYGCSCVCRDRKC